MGDWSDLAKEEIADLQKGIADGAELLGEVKETGDLAFALLGSLGFDLPGMKEERTNDGGWIVNGEVFPGSAATWNALDKKAVKNADLPDWFPFGALILQRKALEQAQSMPNPPKGYEDLGPTPLAAVLCTWVQAGLTADELERLKAADGAVGMAQADPSTMNGAALRAYWCGSVLVAGLRAGDAPAFNAVFKGAQDFWRSGGRCWEIGATPKPENVEKIRDAGYCVGLPLNAAGESTSDLDQFGRLASPARGDWLARARSIVRYLRTGALMQTTTNAAGSFAGFETCMRSGDESCLANYTPQSADFWTALREPWRFGYERGKRVQVVKNTFGTFLAWDFGKPRGITIGAAIAISFPAVVAITTIAALTLYAKGKTGGR